MKPQTATCCYCATGTMRVIDRCYGLTGGQKWGCDTCRSYAVTHDGSAPEKQRASFPHTEPPQP